jgi:ribosomal protein S6--L-glutamate ligase
VYLVKDLSSLSEALRHLGHQERSGLSGFVTQALVASNGNVLRVVIIGKRTISYWKRPSKPEQVITTISRDAVIDHDWRPDLQEKGKRHAQALAGKTGINLAAMDFVYPLWDNSAEPLFLEINYYFGRRGLGGTENYYRLLNTAVQDWLREAGLGRRSVKLI